MADGGEPDPAESGEASVGHLRRSWRFLVRHRRGLGTLVVGAAVFALGVTAGWWLRDGTHVSDPPVIAVTVDRPVATSSGTGDIDVSVPNVLGLQVDRAREVLADAGATADSIDVRDTPSAGRAGRVVVQDPPAGVPATGTVTLGVARPAQVPELIGRPVAEARTTLDELGARVRVVSRYDPDATEGTVLQTTPAAGERLDTDVELVAAAPPSSIFLSTLDPLQSDCRAGAASINGTDHAQSLRCPAVDPDRTDPTIYLLDRRATQVVTTIGQDDASEPSATARYVIRGDGQTLAEGTIGYGEDRELTLDVRDVLRFSIEVNVAAQPDDVDRPVFVLGNARVIGGPDQLALLTQED